MAKQESIIKFDGKLGEVQMIKGKDGYSARKKSGVKKSRIMEDAAYARTREHLAEFKRAALASSLIRRAFRVQILEEGAVDRRITSRLIKSLLAVVKSDNVNDRGLRNVANGNITLIKGIEFNIGSPLDKCLLTDFTATIDRTAGSLTVIVPAFSPDKFVIKPDGALFFQLTSTGCEIDFETGSVRSETAGTAFIPLKTEQQEAITLTTSIPNSTKPLLLSFGIRFYEEVNGKYYVIGNSNALSIVQVDGGA